MAKVSVIYRAPVGDSKVCELGGFTFFDGMPLEIEDNEDNAHLISRLSIPNPIFELSEMGEVMPPEPAPPFDDYVPIEDVVVKRKRGRPRKELAVDDDNSEGGN